jgi:hypothetical protein
MVRIRQHKKSPHGLPGSKISEWIPSRQSTILHQAGGAGVSRRAKRLAASLRLPVFGSCGVGVVLHHFDPRQVRGDEAAN